MLILRNLLRTESVFVVSRTLFSTGVSYCKQKGLVRRPFRIWSPEHAQKLAQGKSPEDTSGAHRQTLSRFPDELTNKKFSLPEGVSYVKLEDGDKRFKHVMAAKSRKDRREKEVILLEGQRLICDAIDAGVKIKLLYFSKVEHLEDIPLLSLNAELYKVNYRQLQLFSDVATSTGLMAIAELPKENQAAPTEGLMPITVICDNIRDPGNLGTIIRCVAASGCKRIILTKGCVDPWEPKVVRSGAGAHFRCNLIHGVTWQMIGNYLSGTSQVFLADNKSKHSDFVEGSQFRRPSEKLVDIDSDELETETGNESKGGGSGRLKKINISSVYDADFTTCESAIVIGGETHGLSPPAYRLAADFAGASIYLPMMPGVESINAAMATAGILFEARRQYLLHGLNFDNEADSEYGKDESISSN